MKLKTLKEQKKKLKLTFNELSEMTNIPKRTLEEIFAGRTQNPRIDTMEAIEKALGLQSEERAQGIGDYVNTPLTANESEFLNLYRDIGDKYGADRQKTVLKLLEAILDEN